MPSTAHESFRRVVPAAAAGVSAGVAPKISFGSWAFAFGPFQPDPWSFLRVCRYVADAGYDGIEINGFRPHPHDVDYADDAACDRLGGQIDELGLGISAYAPDFSRTPPADVPAADFLARVDSTLAFCRRMGIGILRIDSISPPGPRDVARFDHLVTSMRRAAARAADQGVLLVWEFEPGFWLNRPSEVLGTLTAVDHANFKVLFDTSHAYTGAVKGARQGPEPEPLPGGEVQYASMLRPYLGHLHLIDSDGSLHHQETSAHLAFGTGKVQFAEVIAAAGPQALALPWWTVDFCFNANVEQEGRRAVPFVQDLIDRAIATQETEVTTA